MRSKSTMARRLSTLLPLCVLFLACGPGDDQRTLPDETGDLDVGGAQLGHLQGTRPATPALDGSHWRFVEASCTEGDPRYIGEGFQRTLDVHSDNQGLLLIADHSLGEDCQETVVQRARPGAESDQAWSMREDARVHLGECPTDPEPDRPGDVRLRGEFLEVYVQRSNWCNGLEVKMVYAPADRESYSGEELIRRYAAHFNRRDAQMITELFAANGSLLDPFSRTPTDQPLRVDGQAAIYEWFREAFANTNWLALRVTGIEEGPAQGAFTMTWEYMDPRLEVPFGGRNLFTIAAGEIFETSIEITQQEVEVDTPAAAAPAQEEAAQEAEAETETAAPPAPTDPEAGSE